MKTIAIAAVVALTATTANAQRNAAESLAACQKINWQEAEAKTPRFAALLRGACEEAAKMMQVQVIEHEEKDIVHLMLTNVLYIGEYQGPESQILVLPYETDRGTLLAVVRFD